MNKVKVKSAEFEVPNVFDSLEVELQETMDADGPFTLMEILRIHNYVSILSRRQRSNTGSCFISGSV
jgi:hypothetical protein